MFHHAVRDFRWLVILEATAKRLLHSRWHRLTAADELLQWLRTLYRTTRDPLDPPSVHGTRPRFAFPLKARLKTKPHRDERERTHKVEMKEEEEREREGGGREE